MRILFILGLWFVTGCTQVTKLAGALQQGTSSGASSSSGPTPGTSPVSTPTPTPIPSATPPPTKLGACNNLGAIGEFQEITPPTVKAGFGVAHDGGGTFALAADPINQGTIYLGTLWQGFWKSTDCGATWTETSGRNSADINNAMNWTLFVDPQNPQIVYTNAGYNSSHLYKSVNGGADWDAIWPPSPDPNNLSKAFQYNFANVIALDPSNSAHLLLTFHESCLPPHPATCIAETFDKGSTWKLIDGQPGWSGNEGQVIFFLNDSQNWLWGSQSNGFWVTTNSGGSWQAVSGMTTSHLQGSQVARSQNGTFYVNGSDGVWSSPDGKFNTWSLIPNTGPISGGLIDNGTTLFASTCYFGGFCSPSDVKFLSSPDSDGKTWTKMANPPMVQGGTMSYDPGHNLLLSSGLQAGLWRIKVK